MTPEEYRQLRIRRAQAEADRLPRRVCHRCQAGYVISGSIFCGECMLLAAIEQGDEPLEDPREYRVSRYESGKNGPRRR